MFFTKLSFLLSFCIIYPSKEKKLWLFLLFDIFFFLLLLLEKCSTNLLKKRQFHRLIWFNLYTLKTKIRTRGRSIRSKEKTTAWEALELELRWTEEKPWASVYGKTPLHGCFAVVLKMVELYMERIRRLERFNNLQMERYRKT